MVAELDNIFKKIIFALSSSPSRSCSPRAVTEGSQILVPPRPEAARAEGCAYLTLDGTTYASVVDERLVWIVDGYTTSSNTPTRGSRT